jgi:predicted alpha/beta hydrolase
MLDNQISTTMNVRTLRFPSQDADLAGTLYLPSGPPVAAIVLNCATGVPQDYYRHFAKWLAEDRGMACLTWDYRDFGASASGRLQESRATMAQWALKDQPAARAEMRRQCPGVPLWVVGHSLGAMMLPLQEGVEDIARVIGVSTGLVYHRDHPWPYQGLARLFWFGHAPVLTHMLGYLPGKAVGFGADLPAGVYWDWRRWCTREVSYLPETGGALPRPDWSRSGASVVLHSFADDEMMPPHCAERLAQVYGDAYAECALHDPAEFGLQSVGHLGAFARANAAVWPVLVPEA